MKYLQSLQNKLQKLIVALQRLGDRMAAVQKFIVRDVMNLFINGKVNTIELCLGDISQIDAERNKVDILLISALPGGYDTQPDTVMHSLQQNLQLSVAELAKDKAVDKRDTHKCWWSKPLQQKNIPFGRVMCYESGGSQAAATEFTNTTFSCLKEIFQKNDCKVATSLLNTGQQKMDEVVMLEAILEAAITAMKSGLNLRQLMMFINAEIENEAASKPKVRDFEGICAKFEALKLKHTI